MRSIQLAHASNISYDCTNMTLYVFNIVERHNATYIHVCTGYTHIKVVIHGEREFHAWDSPRELPSCSSSSSPRHVWNGNTGMTVQYYTGSWNGER